MLKKIWIAPSVMARAEEEANSQAPYETGGILVGYFATTSNRIRGAVITNMVGPGPDAERTATTFQPDHTWQAERLAELYAKSGRLHTYLGDWHTHPGGPPFPSRTDRSTLHTIAKHAAARCPEPIMVIAGQMERSAWRWGAFQLRGPLLCRLRPLEVTILDDV